MGYLGLTLDGVSYRVRIPYDTYADTFTLIEGPNADDMLNDRHERDLIGTKATYEMGIEPDPRHPGDFDALYAALRSPVKTHTVLVFDGQSAIQYECMIQSGRRVFKGILGGVKQYSGSVIQFIPIQPQWEADT